MKIISSANPDTWTLTFTCTHCGTTAEAAPDDLEADEFKISGYHFDGTAQCARRLYILCPTCTHLYMLTDDDVDGVPWALNQRAEQNYQRRRANETTAAASLVTDTVVKGHSTA